jgi:Ca2+-binding RTX toxin-like protein
MAESPHVRRIAVLVVALAAIALPGSASASTITKSGSTISYVADPQEANNVTASLTGGTYTFTEQDAGITIKNGGGCSVAGTTATCPAAGTSLLDIDTGDLNDSVTVTAPTSAHLFGGAGDDSLTGGGGDDVLRGGLGADVIIGGAGTDAVDYSDRTAPLTITVDGQPGDGEAGENDNVGTDVEIVNGGSGADTITGSEADNVLNGNGGNDTLNGAGGDDALNRGDFDGNLDPGTGADALSGGPGRDSVSYASAKAPVRVSLDGRPGDGARGENDNVATDVENVTGGSAGDVLIGSAGDNVLQGGPGDDRLLGGGGADTLDGGSGSDAIQSLDRVADQIICGAGDGVLADKSDVLHACGSVQRAPVKVLARKAKARRGAVRIPISCSPYVTESCKGSVTLKSGATALGRGTISAFPGRRATVKVELSKKGRRLLAKRRKLTAAAKLVVVDPSGGVFRRSLRLGLSA